MCFRGLAGNHFTQAVTDWPCSKDSNLLNFRLDISGLLFQVVVNPADFSQQNNVVQHVLEAYVLHEQRIVKREEAVANATDVAAHSVCFQL